MWSWLFTKRLSATRYTIVKRMGITEMLRWIWLFTANKIKSSESGSTLITLLGVPYLCHFGSTSFVLPIQPKNKNNSHKSKQPIQLIVKLNSSLRHIIVTMQSSMKQSSGSLQEVNRKFSDNCCFYFRKVLKIFDQP